VCRLGVSSQNLHNTVALAKQHLCTVALQHMSIYCVPFPLQLTKQPLLTVSVLASVCFSAAESASSPSASSASNFFRVAPACSTSHWSSAHTETIHKKITETTGALKLHLSAYECAWILYLQPTVSKHSYSANHHQWQELSKLSQGFYLLYSGSTKL